MSFKELFETVIEQKLCTRCGICAGICPAGVIGLDGENYPMLTGKCIDCGFCLRACPGGDVDFPSLFENIFRHSYDPDNYHGHLEGLHVSHSTNTQIRGLGTSGGLVTGLLVHLLESNMIDGAVVAGFDFEDPCKMKGILATNKNQIINASQSKYCLTSSMDVLQDMRRRKGRFVVVGLPCQVQGVRKLMKVDPSLGKKIYAVFGLYCHCNMEPLVQLDVLKACGIDQDDVARFSFRGGPWPGGFHVTDTSGREIPLHTTLYTTILNVLFRLYGAKRCYLCVDALSEFADVSFGDFWAHDYTGSFRELEQCTLVSQRTALGRQILSEAEKAGAVVTYELPKNRYSKRILNMTSKKKNRAFARMARLQKMEQAVPDYHVTVSKPGSKAKRSEFTLRLSFLLRQRTVRYVLLKLLFSRTMVYFERVNLLRKRIFCNYHDN